MLTRQDRVLTDRGAVGLALAVAAGAWLRTPIPLVGAVLVAVVAVVLRRPVVLALGLAAVASTMSVRAWNGLDPPANQRFDGVVTLLSDPTDTPFGARADVRVGRRRVELRATGSGAGALSTCLAGERVMVTGRLGPPPPDSPWLVSRHVSGRLMAKTVERHDEGAVHYRAANRFRRLLVRGTDSMPMSTRTLFAGFVLGDDRGQAPEVVDDFRGSGLTHLLVVSGSNVAFLLVIVAPFTRRLGLSGRWVVTVGVILAFALVTRFEPSVLRASVMAGIAVSAGLVGKPATGLRVLALAVTVLIIVDPLLVWSVAFQLSVGASFGIIVIGPWITARLRGPTWWREVVGVTLAAQIGVMPILVPRFGGMPVVSLAANMLSVPVAGLVTTWGLPAGVVAGILGEPFASLLHWPTTVMIGWVAGVARMSAAVPLGEVGTREVIVACGAGAGAWWLRDHRPDRSVVIRSLGCLAVLALLVPAVQLRSPPDRQSLGDGTILYRSEGATVLVVGRTSYPEYLLEDLRQHGVRRIDVVVWTAEPDPVVLRALRHRWAVGPDLSPDDPVVRIEVGGLVVDAGGGDAPVVAVGPEA